MDEVESLVANGIPEGPSLEYKAQLAVRTKGQRIEALKDLTGMGNGGGGILNLRSGRGSQQHGIPLASSALTGRGLVGVLEDIARSSVRPPILMDFAVFEGSGGFLLGVEVLRSPLGPYMVEACGERRYFVRIGT